MPLTRRQGGKDPKYSLPNTRANIGVHPDKLTEKQLNMLFKMNTDDFNKELHTRFTHAELVKVCAKLHNTKQVKAFQGMNKTELAMDITNMLYNAIDNTQNKFYKTAYSVMYFAATIASMVCAELYNKKSHNNKNLLVNILSISGILYSPELMDTIITHILKNIYKQRAKPIFRKMLTTKRRP